MKTRIELSEIGQFCITAMGSLAIGLVTSRIISSFSITNDGYLEEFQRINTPGQGTAVNKPLFVVHGPEDSLVPPVGTQAAFRNICGHGNPVHLMLYPGIDYNSIVTAAAPEHIRFIADRFAGVPYKNR